MRRHAHREEAAAAQHLADVYAEAARLRHELAAHEAALRLALYTLQRLQPPPGHETPTDVVSPT